MRPKPAVSRSGACARLHFDDGIVAPKRRAVVAVVAAILDGQASIEHHILRRAERIG